MSGITNITIRVAGADDAREISSLTTRLLHTHLEQDLSEEGKKNLLETMTHEAVTERLTCGYYSSYVALDGEKVVGVISFKVPNHLYDLFVAESHHGRGIAVKLWEKELHERLFDQQVGEITVNASDYAIGIYKKLGFSPTGPAQWKNGIRSTPMIWKVIS